MPFLHAALPLMPLRSVMTGHSGTIPEAARSELRVYMNIRHCEYMEKGYTIPWLIESSIRHGNFIHLHNLLE